MSGLHGPAHDGGGDRDRDGAPRPLSRRSVLALGGAAVLAAGLGVALHDVDRPTRRAGPTSGSPSSGPGAPPSTTGSGDDPSRPPAGAILPDVAADGRADDRAAIQRALDSAPGDRPVTVWLPGLCRIGQGGISGGTPFGLVVRKNGITLTGAPGAGIISDDPGIRLLLVSGTGGRADDPLAPSRWITQAPTLPFAEEVGEGQTEITLGSPADAARLRPGDAVFLRTGQLTSAALPREPDAELNEVAGVSGARVALRYPTAKPYAREHPAPWGVARATGRVVRDFTVRGLQVLAQSGHPTTSAVHLFQAWGVVVENCVIRFGKYGIAGRYTRGVRVTGTRLQTVGNGGQRDPAWIAPSTGCTDWLVEHCRGGGSVPAKLHAHEGVADLRFVDWLSETADGPGEPGASNISIRARAYRHSYDVQMTGAYTSADCAMLKVSSEVVGPPQQVQFERLRLRGAPGRAFLSIDSTAVTIYRAGLDLPPDATVQLRNGAQPFV